MHRTWKPVFAAILCCLARQAHAQALPDGKGKAEFIHNCTACHRADLVIRVKKTPQEWKENVANMAARGTDGSPEDLDNVTLYLVTNFATTASPTAAAPLPTPSAQAALTPAELETVNGLIADNGCLICHRIEAQGAYTAPSLNGVGAHRTPDRIRASIMHPNPTLDPKNSLAQLTTVDGKKLTARLVSQDDHTVRIIDLSGATVTYARTDLRQFTLIETNPMPSYQKRIAPEDLNSLVRYLGSLPSLDEGIQK